VAPEVRGRAPAGGLVVDRRPDSPQRGAALPGEVRIRRGGERRYAGLLEWVDGTTLAEEIAAAADADFACQRFAALGGIMASIHDQAAGWSVPADFRRHAFDADGLMGEQPFWGRFWESPHIDARERRRLAALRDRIHDLLRNDARLADDAGYSLIHADLHPHNVIVDGSRLHVIDFDDAGFGWHAYDFAVAFYHYRDHPRFDAFAEALIAGYRRLRALGDDVVDLLPLGRFIRPGTPLWDWPTQFLFSHVTRLVAAGLLTAAEQQAFECDWRACEHEPGAFFCTPPMIGIVAEKQ